MRNNELTDDVIGFFRDYYREDIAKLAQKYPREQRSLYVDYDDIFRFSPDLADDVENQPREMQNYFEEALRLYDLPIDVDLSGAHVRIYNLPNTYGVGEVVRKDHIGDLLDVRGQVKKTSAVKPRVVEAVFECQRCGTLTDIPQSGEKLQEPHECQGCERQGPFMMKSSDSTWIDHQHARIQQPPDKTRGGSGDTIDVHLKDDLIEEFDAGDRITLTGVLDVEEPENDQTRNFDTTVDGRAVVREESDYEDINVEEHLEEIEAIAAGEKGDPYELLVDSVNPKHQGDEDVKLALALQMFGAWPREHPDGSRDRGEWHMLLLGDPGCGKSTFLRWVDETAPRSTYASGKGASAAGMTAAVVPDDFGDTEWSLEAGALVLADGGVACVDEVDKVDEKAVSSMHDALESQEVHINKAGINTTLNARSALLAAGNPKHGRFDPYQPKSEQIDLGPTLLSRFDLMFMVSDSPDEEKDREVVRHMSRSRRAVARENRGEELTEEEREAVEPAISKDVLRAYIAHAKDTCRPYLQDEEVEQKLIDYFVNFRQVNQNENEDNPVPITYRKFEAIRRIAESSARVRLSEEIEMEDVERAIRLVESSMRQVGYDPEKGQFDADIIETGQSQSQRERVKNVLSLIEELDGPSREELIEEAEEIGIDAEKANHEIDRLKEKGKVVKVGGGSLRKV
jgi:replicative DNA helicase Mcm